MSRRLSLPLCLLVVSVLPVSPKGLSGLSSSAHGEALEGIPYFARRYGVTCAQCHAAPPKLNAFGEAFVAAGYRDPGLTARPTLPVAVWISSRVETLPARAPLSGDVVAYLNRVELVSGGELVAPWLSYFVEWRPVSLEARSDGSRRDRSGRFEDLFVTAFAGNLEVMVGQFRMLQQVDVSRRLSVSEPLVFSAGLPWTGTEDGTPRERSLRSFSPSGRSPAARVAWTGAGLGGSWVASVAAPLPGELSLPLSREARTEASNEVELDPKGVFLESYWRSGLSSLGLHAFHDGGRRTLLTAVTTGARGPLHGAAALGVDRVEGVGRGRWSLEGEYIPHGALAVGARIEDRAGDGGPAALLPYLNLHHPGTTFTVRLTVEQRLQRGRHATLLELGAVF